MAERGTMEQRKAERDEERKAIQARLRELDRAEALERRERAKAERRKLDAVCQKHFGRRLSEIEKIVKMYDEGGLGGNS